MRADVSGEALRLCSCGYWLLVAESHPLSDLREMTKQMSGFVLSLCDRTGVMVQPWLEAGYPCVIVDVQHERGVHADGLLYRVGCDVRTYDPYVIKKAVVFAFPPCTHLANSGNRYKADKGLEACPRETRTFEPYVWR